MSYDEQKYYWLFSSTAQTISGFIAFIVAGYALVLNIMESAQQKDETLTEIHDKLKSFYYKRIVWLAIISGLAVIFSLVMLYVNGNTSLFTGFLFVFTSLLSLLSIVLATLFIVTIINPDKYKIAAEEIIKEEVLEFSPKGTLVDQADFMDEFMELEKKIRAIARNKQLVFEEHHDDISFRQLASGLFENDMISREQLYELLQLNKYRNLVFHGNLAKVDKGMVERVKTMRAQLQ